MILSGGANIYPAEVEAAIDACKGVRSSAVIGLPHEDLGNAIHAIVAGFLQVTLVRTAFERVSFSSVCHPQQSTEGAAEE